MRLRRLTELPEVRESGATTLRHITAVTRPSIPRRIEAISAMDDELAKLVRHAPPADVEAAVARITDALDHADEAEPLSESGPDERRELTLLRGVGGPTSPGVIRRLAGSAEMQAAMTLGPWRAVSVGRLQRTLRRGCAPR